MLELIVGAFGEMSPDMGRVIAALAESRVIFLARESGTLVTDSMMSVVLAQDRRYFSVVLKRFQAACLMARIGHLNMETREAAGKRRDLLQQKQRSRSEAVAYLAAYVNGRGFRG